MAPRPFLTLIHRGRFDIKYTWNTLAEALKYAKRATHNVQIYTLVRYHKPGDKED